MARDHADRALGRYHEASCPGPRARWRRRDDQRSGGLSGRRILITGGSGFIGRHAVSALSADGAQVGVVDLKPHPDPGVDVVEGDIADPEVLKRAFDGGVDGVVHLAAVTSVLRSLERPELTYRTNVEGTHRVLEAAREAGASSLVFSSTNAVTGPMEEPAITERARLRPLTPYGATKAAGEMLMSAYTASYGVRCTCLRLTNVYGLGMQAKDSIVARLMRAILTGRRSRSTATASGARLRQRQRRGRGGPLGSGERRLVRPGRDRDRNVALGARVLDEVRRVTAPIWRSGMARPRPVRCRP